MAEQETFDPFHGNLPTSTEDYLNEAEKGWEKELEWQEYALKDAQENIPKRIDFCRGKLAEIRAQKEALGFSS